MSLFPAYLVDDGTTDQPCEDPNSWLENTSFVPAIESVPLPPPVEVQSSSRSRGSVSPTGEESSSLLIRKRSSKDDSHSNKHKKKKHKKDKKTTEELLENNYGSKALQSRSSKVQVPKAHNDNDQYFFDTKKDIDNLKMDYVRGPHQPRYFKICKRPMGWQNYKTKKIQLKKRYFSSKAFKANAVSPDDEEEKRPSWDHDVAQDLKSTTADLNRSVAANPCDIEAWMKLVRIQPYLLSLQPRHGPCFLSAQEKRAVADKQVAIIDKALGSNPTNPLLVKERYGLASTLVPADELASQLRKYLSREPVLVAGWLELAQIERSHLASCSIPKIISVFSSAMDAINAKRKKVPTPEVENSILDLLLACGIFLQEASLQEQVWVMLRLYTEMSLGVCRDPEGAADLLNFTNEKAERLENEAAVEEDQLLMSGLPSSELWLRVERVRESAHFLPAPDCIWAREGDPQRLVYPEDLASLSQHITTKSLGFRVASIALVVLGVPPLPFRHSTVNCLSKYSGLPNLGLLAAAYPIFAPDIAISRNWIGDAALQIASTCGANAWKPGLGGELYRDLLYSSFYKYATSLSEPEEIVLMCWCLRWEVLCAKLTPPSSQTVSSIRSKAKKLLKKPVYRTSFQMFREFAMLEAALAQKMQPAEKILTATIQGARASGTKLMECSDRAGLSSVYRTLAEIWIQAEKKPKAIRLLCSLVDDSVDPFADSPLDESVVEDCVEKFEALNRKILNDQTDEDTLDLACALSEDFFTNAVACYAWLMVSSRNVWIAGAMLEGVLLRLGQYATEKCQSQKESVYEIYCAVMQNRSRSSSCDTGMLHDVIERALSEFPDNAALLSMQAQLQNTMRQLCRLTASAKINYTALGYSMRILSLEFRSMMNEAGENESTQVEVLKSEPKVLSQYERVLSNFEFRHCPLLWQLYLRYVGFKASPEATRVVFYKALEDCPWVKALYMQGARLLPEELGNIQDLVVEKELRLHIAPEELELLKGE